MDYVERLRQQVDEYFSVLVYFLSINLQINIHFLQLALTYDLCISFVFLYTYIQQFYQLNVSDHN